mgnify:CR=1 FL=1
MSGKLLIGAGLSTYNMTSFKSYHYFVFVSFSTKDMNYLSESVLKGMCDIVGTEDYVAIRRKIIDNFESRNGSFKFDGQPISTILSGSRREGFRFENSDIDIMCGLEYLKVVWYTFQQQSDNHLKTALLIFDGLDSPPGYGVLDFTGHDFVLPFLREEILIYLDNATICRNGKSYLSSSETKQVVCLFAPFYNEHGPCTMEALVP